MKNSPDERRPDRSQVHLLDERWMPWRGKGRLGTGP